jgi:hypothetical protein
MNERPLRATTRWVHQIAHELCGLVQLQIDTLQRGLGEGDLREYLARRGQIDKLQGEVRNLRRQPS